MIRFFLLQNRQGKTRLSKWYVSPPTPTNGSTGEAEKVRIEADVHRLVTSRDKKIHKFHRVQQLQTHLQTVRGTLFYDCSGYQRQRTELFRNYSFICGAT
mmetsp:Transcript_17686/g.26318  ORF Transcript_17686/g.26318 Transcript_17686/m.26318 type:complete len:100 (+) Transcript_17686:141-440(+)